VKNLDSGYNHAGMTLSESPSGAMVRG